MRLLEFGIDVKVTIIPAHAHPRPESRPEVIGTRYILEVIGPWEGFPAFVLHFARQVRYPADALTAIAPSHSLVPPVRHWLSFSH